MSAAGAAYGAAAPWYDWHTGMFQPYRRMIVDALPLAAGDVVLDAGCGTGLCFPLLLERIGPEGRVIGVDTAPAMLDRARARIRAHGWRNVELIQAPADQALLPVPVDAALLCAVHDVLHSPPALANLLTQVRPGAWVAAGGGKYTTDWLPAMNLIEATSAKRPGSGIPERRRAGLRLPLDCCGLRRVSAAAERGGFSYTQRRVPSAVCPATSIQDDPGPGPAAGLGGPMCGRRSVARCGRRRMQASTARRARLGQRPGSDGSNLTGSAPGASPAAARGSRRAILRAT